MKNFRSFLNKNKFEAESDALLYKYVPQFFMEMLSKYFRLQIEGAENIPKQGGALITPNHSGFAGLDAMLLSYVIHENAERLAKVMTHHFWFLTKATSLPANKLGFVEATKDNGLKMLKKKDLVVLFPEGEHGNFKPTTKAYRLQAFRRGFVRMALEAQVPIVPTVIIGAEETSINLKQLKFSKYLRGTVLPLPLNVLPLPAKWKIKFLPPMNLPYKPSAKDNVELVYEICSDIRERMQRAINEELGKRNSAFF